ncbi:U2 small nuclear ribonucleo protein B''-like protein [Jimgerdemannia flammicorona]|uniref:U2 small nuclear ribonucleo protein B''-like protein n=1 Tax=Jimgerdemannia flammicorona TaxID=994334 RepID=A0A433Q7H3_9FUNG|nr:U2 small nuclear ribonucleo protein B''-like protein [Jimgerdemannia flammicorona]
MASIPPNQTIYIRNLPEKIKKEELKRSLYALFSAYGRILDIVALKTIRMHGQAWIAFREITSATAALRGLNGFAFYDKPMKIEYAKVKSDAVAKLDGTWKKPGLADDAKRAKSSVPAAMLALGNQKRTRDSEDVDMDTRGQGRRKEEENEDGGSEKESEDETMDTEVDKSEVEEPPNRILFLQNLVGDVTEEMLSYLFQQYPGFKEVRLVPGKVDMAFVEYENEGQSALAKDALDHFKLTPSRAMRVTYAKR